MLPDRYFDWHKLHADENPAPTVVDSRRRLRLCLIGFVGLLLLVLGRVVQLEVTHGAAFRAEASRPLARRTSVPGVRGRILAGDGTVLACDKNTPALAVHYRYLQEPADAELARRLAQLSGLSIEEWNLRAGRIQTRVERIAQTVNRRRREQFDRRHDDARQSHDRQETENRSFAERIGPFVMDVLRASIDESPPEWIAVAEQLDYHVMVEDLPLSVVAQIEAHPEQYPGVKIVEHRRRAYPSGNLAAHVLGHLGPVDNSETTGDEAYHADDLVGRTGLERQYENLLRGAHGLAVELTDRSGRIISAYSEREPGVGRDLVVTLDLRLQRSAETLLAGALERRTIATPGAVPAGGAVVVIDVHTGAILAAASAPSFDPNLFSGGGGANVEALLANQAHPLFNRVAKMAIPPGSVFKVVSAVALLEASAIDPEEPFFCQGYLHSPESWRCAVYRRHGVGHGETTLADALAQSCNVYFFHHAEQLGPQPLVDWALRFGFGRPTGVDLPGEAAGTLPSPQTVIGQEDRAWRTGDALAMAIGQSSIEVTPLQVVRMMAAVANGGKLVAPHVVSRRGLSRFSRSENGTVPFRNTSNQINELDARVLEIVREGLKRVVSDPNGTGYGTVRLETIQIAGKTGTAETGSDAGDHAWFAGYVPAEQPKFAFVVALEYSGNADEAAGPVAKRLVLSMQQSGYFVSVADGPKTR